jgi:hypothetical protein
LDIGGLFEDFHNIFEIIFGALRASWPLLVVCFEEGIIFGGHIILTTPGLFDGLGEADVGSRFVKY